MKHLSILLFLATSLVASARLSAEQSSPLPMGSASAAGFSVSKLERLHQRMDRFVADGTLAGYVSLVARDGAIVDWQTGGMRDIEAKAPMEKETIVCIYSISKILTATVLLTLLEEGKLRLDDPVEKYLPELKDRKVWKGGTAEAPLLESAKTPITIRQLMTHTAGYYYDKNADDPVLKQMSSEPNRHGPQTPDEFLSYVSKLPLHDQPGTRYRYSLSYAILGILIERVTGQSLEPVMQERLFRPLRMVDTSFLVPQEKRSRLSRIYCKDANGQLVVDTVAESRVPARGSFYAGGGGLFSTAGDLVRFGQMLLNKGSLDGVRILSPKTVELMTSDQLRGLPMPLVTFTARDTYGLGVGIATDLGKSSSPGTVGNFGWTGAATTLLQMDPQERMVTLVLAQFRPANHEIYGYFINMVYSALETP